MLTGCIPISFLWRSSSQALRRRLPFAILSSLVIFHWLGDLDHHLVAMVKLTSGGLALGYRHVRVCQYAGYVGYYKPYANSQQELDKAEEVWHTIKRQARTLAASVKKARESGMPLPAMPPNSEMK